MREAQSRPVAPNLEWGLGNEGSRNNSGTEAESTLLLVRETQ